MTIADLNPDTVLAKLLDDKIRVRTSATQSHTIRCYDDESRPNKGVGDEFVQIGWNGPVKSLTQDSGPYSGDLMLEVWVKTQTDGRAKKKLVRQIVAQVAPLVHRKVAGGFVFTFDSSQVITPTTVNLSNGYSTTILNVEWRESK